MYFKIEYNIALIVDECYVLHLLTASGTLLWICQNGDYYFLTLIAVMCFPLVVVYTSEWQVQPHLICLTSHSGRAFGGELETTALVDFS